VKFPKDWIIGKLPCPICIRENVDNKEEENESEIEYYGGVATETCDNCHRLVCPLHYNSTKRMCDDCVEVSKTQEKERN